MLLQPYTCLVVPGKSTGSSWLHAFSSSLLWSLCKGNECGWWYSIHLLAWAMTHLPACSAGQQQVVLSPNAD